jgi:hypothetical protein
MTGRRRYDRDPINTLRGGTNNKEVAMHSPTRKVYPNRMERRRSARLASIKKNANATLATTQCREPARKYSIGMCMVIVTMTMANRKFPIDPNPPGRGYHVIQSFRQCRPLDYSQNLV